MTYSNSRKDSFLGKLPDVSFNSDGCTHAKRSKFNFSYFDCSQQASQNFSDWSHEQLYKLLDKLKIYSKEPLSYWMNQRCGAGSRKILEVYGGFPKKSDFLHPKHIPIDVQWARFRLEGDMRLIGFLIPAALNGVESKDGSFFDMNVFYVVFLDENHTFYKTK